MGTSSTIVDLEPGLVTPESETVLGLVGSVSQTSTTGHVDSVSSAPRFGKRGRRSVFPSTLNQVTIKFPGLSIKIWEPIIVKRESEYSQFLLLLLFNFSVQYHSHYLIVVQRITTINYNWR